MKQIASRSVIMLLFVLLFAFGGSIFLISFAKDGDTWAAYPTNRHVYSADGMLSKAGIIYDRDGVELAKTVDGVRSFAAGTKMRKATVHAIGDLKGKIATGVHSQFFNQLTGYDMINGTYNISGAGNDVHLTLDAEISVTAMDALGSNAGAVGVYNYKTGEIVCMVSTPTFDPTNPPSDKNEAAGLYVNRMMGGKYTPGSIFKLVTAIAAIDHVDNIMERKFTCKQGIEIGGEWVSCMHNHGEITFEQGLVKSCNAVFALLADEMGKDIMTKTAEKIGFNKSFSVDGIPCTTGSYSVENAREIELAWSGMGQYTNLVNPMQYLIFMGAIANKGVPVEPYLVDTIKTPAGFPIRSGSGKNGSRMMSASTAGILTDMMRKAVQLNYGDSTFPGFKLCAKTGTAEVKDEPHSWFVGFNSDDSKPYAFVVVVENAGAGIKVAAKVANTVLQKLR